MTPRRSFTQCRLNPSLAEKRAKQRTRTSFFDHDPGSRDRCDDTAPQQEWSRTIAMTWMIWIRRGSVRRFAIAGLRAHEQGAGLAMRRGASAATIVVDRRRLAARRASAREWRPVMNRHYLRLNARERAQAASG